MTVDETGFNHPLLRALRTPRGKMRANGPATVESTSSPDENPYEDRK
jgi:hypothetical protein